MIQYHEILRLKSLEFSEQNIAHSCGVSRNTASTVYRSISAKKKLIPSHFLIRDFGFEATVRCIKKYIFNITFSILAVHSRG